MPSPGGRPHLVDCLIQIALHLGWAAHLGGPLQAAYCRATRARAVGLAITALEGTSCIRLCVASQAGRLIVCVHLFGRCGPDYRLCVSLDELPPGARAVVASQVTGATMRGGQRADGRVNRRDARVVATVDQRCTIADSLARCLRAVDEGLQITDCGCILTPLRRLKSKLVSFAVVDGCGKVAARETYWLDYEPILIFDIVGAVDTWRGQTPWHELDPQAAARIVRLTV